MNVVEVVVMILSIFILFLFLGCILLGWKSAIRKENGIHDFGITSNSQKKWFMDTVEYKNTWLGIHVTGKYSGDPPRYGQVVYYRNKGMNIPVLIYGIKNKEKQKLTLKLFGIRSSQIRPNGVLTNVRKSEQIRSSKKMTDIQYPIIVKRRLKNLLLSVACIGFGVILSVYMVIHFQVPLSLFLILGGIILVLIGITLMIDYFWYRLEITENEQMIITSKRKKHYYRIHELNYLITNPNADQYVVIIQDLSKNELARMDSKDLNGIAAYQVIKEAISTKQQEEFYRKLLDMNFYLPLSENGLIGEVENDNPNRVHVRIYDSLDLLEKTVTSPDWVGDEVITLEEMVKLTKQFTLIYEIDICQKEKEEVVYYAITKEIWEKIKDLKKVS